MQTVIPAIIPESFADLKESLEIVSPFAEEVQIDIVDGKFVPFISWPYGEAERIEDVTLFSHDHSLEFDLMIERPEDHIGAYVKAGAKQIVVHAESTGKLEDILNVPNRDAFKLGLSILNSTPLDTLTKYVERIDYVQLMGIAEVGSQGQAFDESVLERITKLRSDFPDLLISIDGSVNKDTLPRLKEVGADRFVSGSAILGAHNPESVYDELTKLSL